MDAPEILCAQRRQVGGRQITIIDGIFRADFIELFDHFLRTLRFSLADYDAEDSRHVLHWIHEFQLDAVTNHPLLSFAYSSIKTASDEICPDTQIVLNRVHCNTSLYGDMQFPHQDLTPGLTWLYYANPVWKLSWMGETMFYDGGEPVHAVFPKPGRVIVFAGDMFHRGGVPSRECMEARRSIAFKFLKRTEDSNNC
jgi:hypothetical protein